MTARAPPPSRHPAAAVESTFQSPQRAGCSGRARRCPATLCGAAPPPGLPACPVGRSPVALCARWGAAGGPGSDRPAGWLAVRRGRPPLAPRCLCGKQKAAQVPSSWQERFSLARCVSRESCFPQLLFSLPCGEQTRVGVGAPQACLDSRVPHHSHPHLGL